MFNRATVRNLMNECADALKVVADKYDLDLVRKSVTYQTNECPIAFKMITRATDDDGNVISPNENEWKRNAILFGMKASDFGKEFISNNRKYTISGIKPRSTKYPILARRSDGKVFKFSTVATRTYLESHNV
ncbi:hypothetical protein LCGC14_0478490 [marine sediment metagenome]|uniref:Uncharacterized protein n=1 Tax=marine sediment metagenome TaxID=412755 RepID=A0A0F9S9X7_9ZZZZ